MLVNPSIYNNLGRFTNNYDLLTLQKKSGSASYTAKLTGYPYKNSLTEQINQQAFQKLSDFDNNFRFDLKSVLNSVKQMSNAKSDIYNSRNAVENSKAFDVSTKDGAALGKQTLKISQLATAQKNTSVAKAQNEVFDQTTNGTLSIKQNGKTQTFNLSMKEGETVEDSYLRMAKTINQGQTGVKAEVKTDENGYSRLNLTSTQTGTESTFEVSGTMAEELKLNDNQEDATNMNYELNGKAATAQTNQLKLEDGKINIAVKATNTAAETFDIEASSKGLVDTLKAFATSFNKFVEDNKGNDNPMAKSITKQLTNTVRKALDKMDIEGLNTNSDGQVVIDEAKLTKGLESNIEQVKESLSKFDSFASNLTRKTEQVLKMPLYDISPDFTNHRIPIKPYMYNYDAQSALNNISQISNPGTIMDVRI